MKILFLIPTPLKDYVIEKKRFLIDNIKVAINLQRGERLMKLNNMKHLNLVLEKLDYTSSKNFSYYRNNKIDSHIEINENDKKILQILSPNAIYFNDNKPFILFYSDENQIDFKSIWNSQIPLVFVIKVDTVFIYTGKNLSENKDGLHLLYEESINNLDVFSYWQIHDEKFINQYRYELQKNELNQSLLDNIEFLTDYLKNELNINFATRLVLRLIFIRFLIDRGVNLDYLNFTDNVEKSRKEFLNLLGKKHELYQLFQHLKEKFSGSLFDLENDEDPIHLSQEVFTVLKEFFSGELVLKNGQISLFPLYDFNIISVELISNIYEILLGNEGQQKNKSFYTPSYLVDYILSNTVDADPDKMKSIKILDPSCGSGIFLVKSYKKILEANRDVMKDMSSDDIDKFLINKLENNVFGIDLSSEAIDVTVFSLYLTLLDFKDPKTLKQFHLPKLIGRNLFINDFLDDNLIERLANLQFDFILGNPPWGSITGKTNEISTDFIYQIEKFVSTKTVVSLVLPSKILYNQKKPAVKLRRFLLEKFIIHEVLDMSSVRKEIFKNAKAPAVILTIQRSESLKVNLQNKLTHISLKPNLFFELFDTLVIEKNDVKYVEQNILLSKDWAWKVLLYGTSWDLKICSNLKDNYLSIKDTIKARNADRPEETSIIYGTGIQDQQNKDQKDSRMYIGKKLLNSKNGLDHFELNLECSSTFTKEFIHRVRIEKLFKGPFVLYKKGLDMKNFRVRAVYSEDSFLFKDTISAIKGEMEDQVFLKSVTGLLNSSLYVYLNIMLNTSLGIEREQAFPTELLNYPFLNSEPHEAKLAEYVDEIQNLSEDLFTQHLKEDISQNIDSLVLDAFNLKNNTFIDYAVNIQGPLIRKEKYQVGNITVSETQMINYAQVFYNYFTKLYSNNGLFIKSNVFTSIANQFAVFELKIIEDTSEDGIFVDISKRFDKELLSKFSVYSFTDSIYSIKDVIIFEDDSFYIIKKNLFKNWHPAMAEKDLSEVIDIILRDEG